MKTLATITCLMFALCCLGADQDRISKLIETVRAANESLQTNDYDNTVRLLFHLTNEKEISSAAVHLQRPVCLSTYKQLFAQLVRIKPIFDGEPPLTASFISTETVVVGKNPWDRFDRLEVMFIFDGSQWIFHDPSFERNLGRRITSKE